MMRSMFIPTLLAGSLVLTGGLSARGQANFGDLIKTTSEGSVRGTVETVTRNEIVATVPTGSKTIPAGDIESIIFAGEPAEMREGRFAANNGDFKKASGLLDPLSPDNLPSDIVRAELSWLKALCTARMALGGQSDDDSGEQSDPTAAAKDAGHIMVDFLKAYPNTYHFYQANEIVGDLLMSIGQYAGAENYYKKLADSPSPDLKARAELLRGRAMQVEGKYDEALAAYDAVLKSSLKGKVGEQEMIEAKVGRTYSLAASGKVDEAIKVLQDIIAKADDDDTELLARAYDALGNCYRKQKDSKQALWAYLRVDTLYRSVPEAHAEALANLVILWGEAKRSDRAREAKDYLGQHYPFSRWNKQIK